jgi:starch synthase
MSENYEYNCRFRRADGKLKNDCHKQFIPFIRNLQYYKGLRSWHTLIYAAADFLLVPSRVEPCGLNQMYS